MAALSSSAFAGEVTDTVSLKATVDVLNQVQEHQNRIDYLMAPIKSTQELNAYLSNVHKGESPLDRLSAPARERFLASLKFGDNGLASYSYVELESELSATEIYRILSLFGAQHTTSMLKNARQNTPADRTIMSAPINSPYDYRDFWCWDRATCAKSLDYICTSNC